MTINDKPQTAEDILRIAAVRFAQKARRKDSPQIERVKAGSKMGPSWGAKTK